ncbi:hypothetical protein SAY86_009484 [Trapa natans]|uniref:Uncharacterized protein n=1 Tax=Trapa natans TaxID=22666 RepID=A0AAN7KYG1_TRANT|nr:hypothetical protein SAY86_009484 [Trapa natans]
MFGVFTGSFIVNTVVGHIFTDTTPCGSSYGKVFKVLVVAIKNSCVLRFFDKAAVKTGDAFSWRLCTVTQVEEAKQLLKMVPIFIATIILSLIFSQVQTFFIKPLASLKSIVQIFMLISLRPGNAKANQESQGHHHAPKNGYRNVLIHSYHGIGLSIGGKTMWIDIS